MQRAPHVSRHMRPRRNPHRFNNFFISPPCDKTFDIILDRKLQGMRSLPDSLRCGGRNLNLFFSFNQFFDPSFRHTRLAQVFYPGAASLVHFAQ